MNIVQFLVVVINIMQKDIAINIMLIIYGLVIRWEIIRELFVPLMDVIRNRIMYRESVPTMKG